MPIPIIGLAVAGGIALAATLMGRHDNKQADSKLSDAREVVRTASNRAVRRVRALNTKYQKFFETARQRYDELYEDVESVCIAMGVEVPKAITPPGELRAGPEITIVGPRKIDIDSLDWKAIGQRTTASVQAAPRLAPAQTATTALAGAQVIATRTATTFAISAAIDYAEKSQHRLTGAVKELAEAQAYARQKEFEIDTIKMALDEDLRARAEALQGLFLGYESAAIAAGNWKIAIPIFDHIRQLIDRPIPILEAKS